MIFYKVGQIITAITEGKMASQTTVTTNFLAQKTRLVVRNWGRNHVDCPAYRVGACSNCRGAFQDFNTVHTTRGREVISRGRGIGSRRNKYTVFHQGNLATAVTVGPSDADIGAQTESLFIADIKTGHIAENTGDIGIVKHL